MRQILKSCPELTLPDKGVYQSINWIHLSIWPTLECKAVLLISLLCERCVGLSLLYHCILGRIRPLPGCRLLEVWLHNLGFDSAPVCVLNNTVAICLGLINLLIVNIRFWTYPHLISCHLCLIALGQWISCCLHAEIRSPSIGLRGCTRLLFKIAAVHICPILRCK